MNKSSAPKLYQRRIWRISLVLGAFLIILFSVYYTTELTNRLKQEEHKHIELWRDAQKSLVDASDAQMELCDYTLHSKIQELNTTIPVILTDSDDNILDALNYKGRDVVEDRDFFAAKLPALREEGNFFLIETPLYKSYIYYENSTLIQALEWFPYVQIVIILVFVGLAYLTWSAARQSEQERVWVGMAKETAHQLGTPITSLIGWVENLRAMYETDDYITMVASEIEKDIHLLEVVAERFSKMGTTPELKPTNIVENLDRYHNYIKQRASRKIKFDFPDAATHAPVYAQVNSLLFDWVIENLLKNALDAMEGEGEITAKVSEDEQYVYVDIHDTGKGMPKNLYKKIFEPGFSTKKRGWGLGLSLCKRIIQIYHRGRIYVRYSAEGVGTIFRIELPKK